MKIINKSVFYIGISVFVILLFSYFIKFESDSGANYVVEDTLLGILIFHNLFVFILYIAIVVILVFLGFKKINLG